MKYILEWVWYVDGNGGRWIEHSHGWMNYADEWQTRKGTDPYGNRFWRCLMTWIPESKKYATEYLRPGM